MNAGEAATALVAAEALGGRVRFAWSDAFQAEFASAWLLDNAPPAADPSAPEGQVSQQRSRTARSLALAGPLARVVVTGDTARLEFAHEMIEWPGGLLRARALAAPGAADETTPWASGTLVAGRAATDYQAYLTDDAALAGVLSEVTRFGLGRLTGAGLESGELERAVRRFGFIRETNYGRLFEVRVVANPDNLANTARALEPHADNPYRDPVPTLQLLHCFRNAGEGGATFLVDGLDLAEWFREAHPEDFARLATRAVPFAFTNAAGEVFRARSPVLRLTADGALTGIRLNHRALGAVDFPAAETALWYESYLKFAAEADAPARRISLDMRPGDIVIFDNERILHGREAFAGAADRLLRGCYADRDGLRATLARLAPSGR